MNKSVLGNRIREQRKRLHMSQEQLAERMFLPKSTISAYENGTAVKHERLVELAQALHTTPNYLLGFDERIDSYTITMMRLLTCVQNETVKEILLKQVKAVCD